MSDDTPPATETASEIACATGGIDARSVVRSAAWTIPVIAASAHVPPSPSRAADDAPASRDRPAKIPEPFRGGPEVAV